MDTTNFPNSQKLKLMGLKFSKGALKLGEQTFTNFNTQRLLSLWDFQTTDIKNNDYLKKYVAVLSLQRHFLGRVVESLVLVDRFLLAGEKFSGFLVPVFDKRLSPRSFCLGAFKTK